MTFFNNVAGALAKKPLARIVLDTFFGTPMLLMRHPGNAFFVEKIVQWDNTCL